MMFKQLRNRLLLVNMIIISALLVSSFAIIYGITAHNVADSVDNALRQAMQMNRFDKQRKDDNAVLPQEDNMQNPPLQEDMKLPADDTHKGDTPDQRPEMSARFTVLTDLDGNICEIHTPFEVTDESYQSEIPQIIRSGKESGHINYSNGEWAYKYMKTENNYIIAFADITSEKNILVHLIIILSLVGIAALAIAFIISLTSANRSIKPVEEAYNKQKQFVADASHELKTPLTTINTNVDVLLSHGDATINDERKWLEYVKGETERMTKLTNDLLYLARLDHNEDSVIQSITSWSDAIENTILTMEAVVFEKNIDFNYDIMPDINVNASAEQLKQLAMILLDNAIKYTPERGKIDMTLNRNKNGEPVLKVKNTGEGIDENEKKQIFERFYRTDKSRARESGGYGLGLAIAKAITSYSGGTISVDSKLGEWTEFSVKIPEKNK